MSTPELELLPELVWANAMCPLIADVLTTNTLTTAAIATSTVEIYDSLFLSFILELYYTIFILLKTIV